MQTVVIVIHLMIVARLIATVLLQKSEGGGLGMGGGAGFMSSRGTANLLTRTTAVLAVGFFATSLFLSWLASYDRKPSSIIGSDAGLAVAAGRTGDAGRAADRRRHSGFAEESRTSSSRTSRRRRGRRRRDRNKAGWPCRTDVWPFLHQKSPSRH